MARGGYRPGAGRPRGTGTKKPAETKREKKAAATVPQEDKTPLDYMLGVMNDPGADEARRDRMAVAAAPFVHTKKGEGGKKEERQDAAKKAATGKFSPPAPPRLVANNGNKLP